MSKIKKAEKSELEIKKAPAEKYKVIGGALNLRADPDMHAAVLAVIPDGDEIEVEESESSAEWKAASYKNLRGYCKAKFLIKK